MNTPPAPDREKRSADKASRMTMYYYLAFLGYLIFQPLADPDAGLRDWLVVALLVAAFLPLYLRAYTRGGRDMVRGLIGIAALGFVGTFFNVGATVFYVYAGAMAGLAYGAKLAWRIILGLCALIVIQATLASLTFYADAMPYILFSFGFVLVFTFIIGGINVYEGERERANYRLHLAQEEVERLAAVAERERIARDLHDLLGHTLSMITLKSELASKLAERDPERAAKETREIERISREALAQVRSAVRGYRARGLKAELADAKLALNTAGIGFDYYSETLELTPDQESVLALALREAVTNIVRHSGASHCSVRLHEEKDQVVLEMKDDGKGGVVREGSGLAGMRERAMSLGGTLTLKSSGGTSLTLALPKQSEGAGQVRAKAWSSQGVKGSSSQGKPLDSSTT